MSAPLPIGVGACCSTCPPLSSGSGGQGPPGPTGPTGPAGAAGIDGIDSFTLTTAQFTQPAALGFVSVSVENSMWISPGQIVYIQNGGYYSVSSVPTSLTATLVNLDYAGNAAPTSLIAASSKVSPAGLVGPTGATGPSGDLSVFFNAGDPNGVVTATRPALCYTPGLGLWMKTGAGTTNTGWDQVIADQP